MWYPSRLFQTGDILLWYDPSDLTTMFQDTAGTQPVTADGQSVALMLDKGGLSDGRGVVNRLRQTQDLSNAAWNVKINVTVTQTGAVPRNGVGNMSRITETAVTDAHVVSQSHASITGSAFSIEAKAGTRSRMMLYQFGSVGHGVGFDLSDGTTFTVSGVTLPADYGIIDLGGGFYLPWMYNSAAATSSHIYPINGTAFNYAGDTGMHFDVWGAQLEAGTSRSAYQPNGATVGGPGYPRFQGTPSSCPKYKTDGTRHWLLYDGIDDSHQTAAINWGTDEVAACVGARKTSDAASGAVFEFSPSAFANDGAFSMLAPSAIAANLFFRSKGTGDSTQARTTYTAPITVVLTGLGKISTDTNRFRINADETTVAADQGTGNYGNFVMNFGRRNNASVPLSGHEYQTVFRSRLLSASELANLETYVAAKTGVTL